MKAASKTNRYSWCARLGAAVAVLGLQGAVLFAGPDWQMRESRHFIVLYRQSHEDLVPHILGSAEEALGRLQRIFDYIPSEKIIINTYDFSDYGRAGATTLPHNYIRLEIEPLEIGYENMPYDDRVRWLIQHELVHIVINDQASRLEAFSRSMFSKVPPEKSQPLSIVYSRLTNFNRYSPRWHQEGIAVFFETWLSGGFGRALGNFDEMYFRAHVLEGLPFESPANLEANTTHNTFLLDTMDYLYGARFVSYLAATYGVDRLVRWYETNARALLNEGFRAKFSKDFGCSLEAAWAEFCRTEKQFQTANLDRLRAAPLTPLTYLKNEPMGWVTQAFLDASGTKLIFGHHQPDHLTSIKKLDLSSGALHEIGSLPAPSFIQIASTAFDPGLNYLFYTTNNNKLYRDVSVLDVNTRKSREIITDARVGQLTVAAATHELWGIRHAAGKAMLVYASYPYRGFVPLVAFAAGDELQHLAISPSGRYLAATLHQSSGRQAIIVTDITTLKEDCPFTYKVISEEGSPEFPSWSADETTLYWNAYTNGVSNIYRADRETGRTEALSHTLRGLFRPLQISADSLFAFEFTSTGFVPVMLANRPAERLPAIAYFGQLTIERNPEIARWSAEPVDSTEVARAEAAPALPFKSAANVKVHSFIPVISGFQGQAVLGLYSHIADPLYVHDLTFEAGVSPSRENRLAPRYHLRANYEFKRRYKLGLEYNSPQFYDLFNERKRGMIGTKVTAGHTHFWKYDNPHTVTQKSEVAVYTGVTAINDNLVKVSRPDFAVVQSALNSTNLRRAIGSVDKEQGREWSATLMTFINDPGNSAAVVGGLHLEWEEMGTWAVPHNVLRLKFSAGARKTRRELAIGKFYFGGFGNRFVEDGEVKQFRKVFRFAGLPIYSLAAQRFAKVSLENNLPALRFRNLVLGQHSLSHLDASIFSQGLWAKSAQGSWWWNAGAQVNLVFKHWFNLETTLSGGIARAWSEHDHVDAWFVSIKLLKN